MVVFAFWPVCKVPTEKMEFVLVSTMESSHFHPGSLVALVLAVAATECPTEEVLHNYAEEVSDNLVCEVAAEVL